MNQKEISRLTYVVDKLRNEGNQVVGLIVLGDDGFFTTTYPAPDPEMQDIYSHAMKLFFHQVKKPGTTTGETERIVDVCPDIFSPKPN